MKQHVVKNDKGQYVKTRGRPVGWTDDIAQARVFSGSGPANNSDARYRRQDTTEAVPFLHEIPDVVLLAELIRRNGHSEGPKKTTYGAGNRETLVGIGKDNTACITIFEDDLKVLDEMTCS